jgi:uncharacterized protein (TIGR04222 family)
MVMFIALYIVLGIVVNLLLCGLILRKEKKRPDEQLIFTDPYKLAFLRAGADETLRVVIFSLIDRGLIKLSGTALVADPNAIEIVMEPIEQTVIDFLAVPRSVQETFDDPAVFLACDVYLHELNKEALLTNDNIQNVSIVALYTLIVVSLIGIAFELTHDQNNIGYLVIMTIIFITLPVFLWFRTFLADGLSGAGKKVLLRARLKFEPLKTECSACRRPGGTTNDAVFLVATFGLAALPSIHFPYVAKLAKLRNGHNKPILFDGITG